MTLHLQLKIGYLGTPSVGAFQNLNKYFVFSAAERTSGDLHAAKFKYKESKITS